jgi:hypothetical protein
MRTFNNQTVTAKAGPMPFDGLGLPMESVRAAAREMRPVIQRHAEDSRVAPPVPAWLRQSGGYSLLVALGREIRGR